MPYIKSERREELLNKPNPETPGELNYVVTIIVDDYLHFKGVNYENINAVIGVLECAKQELYRRVAAPYEDVKCKENGDVYR